MKMICPRAGECTDDCDAKTAHDKKRACVEKTICGTTCIPYKNAKTYKAYGPEHSDAEVEALARRLRCVKAFAQNRVGKQTPLFMQEWDELFPDIKAGYIAMAREALKGKGGKQ